MDVYENSEADIEKRIADLISQMTLERRPIRWSPSTGSAGCWKTTFPPRNGKTGFERRIGAIDEHLNGFRQWGLPPSDNPYVWPASRHAWALNEVQRFFIEETRLEFRWISQTKASGVWKATWPPISPTTGTRSYMEQRSCGEGGLYYRPGSTTSGLYQRICAHPRCWP